MNTEPAATSRSTSGNPLLIFGVAALASLLFALKAIFAKLAYQMGAGAMTVLALRNLIALPVFLAVFWWTNRRAARRIEWSDWKLLLFLGFIGYYLASLLDFKGLEHISAGLERMVLFTYPAMVVFGTALVRRRLPRPGMVFAALAAWGGIALAFAAEARSRTGSLREMTIGVSLVLLSAGCYAIFVYLCGEAVRRIGSVRFMAAACSISGMMILVHWGCISSPQALAELPSGVWMQGALLAILGTIIPSFLTGLGLKLAGAQKFAVIGTIGPVGTLILAWLFLGESIDLPRLAGFALTLCGGLGASLLREPEGTPQAPR